MRLSSMPMTQSVTMPQGLPARLFDKVSHGLSRALSSSAPSPHRVWNEVARRAANAAHRAALHVALRSAAPLTLLAEHAAELRRLPYYRAEYFPPVGSTAWLDSSDAAQHVAYRQQRRTLTPQQAEACLHFAEHGYVILPKLLSDTQLDSAWSSYDRDIRDGRTPLQPPPRHETGAEWARLLNTHQYSPAMAKLLRSPELLRWTELLLGHTAAPVQSIASLFGREPPVHSDALHVSSFPLGHVVAAAIAFEDCGTDCGPLQIYPGTHRLPYVMSHDVGIAPGEPWLQAYTQKYEPYMQAQLEEHAPKPLIFAPEKGDVLLYHQNLWHAGTQATHPTRTRRSMVAHYISRGALAYQDIHGRLLGIF